MTVLRTVRIVRVIEVPVEAEYGDTLDDLCQKATEPMIQQAGYTENRLVLEEFVSQYATLDEYQAANPEPALDTEG